MSVHKGQFFVQLSSFGEEISGSVYIICGSKRRHVWILRPICQGDSSRVVVCFVSFENIHSIKLDKRKEQENDHKRK